MHNFIAFVDFDGTITTEDTLYGTLRMLVPEEEFNRKHEALRRNETTLSRVIHEAIERTPSSMLTDFLDYVETVKIREGFDDFLSAMSRLDIPVVILSGGLRPLVEAKLEGFRGKYRDLYCVDLDTDGPLMRLSSEYDDGVELMKKTRVMGRYSFGKSICIGDSYSDLRMALAGDIVFARDYLAQYLEDTGKAFRRWESFPEVTAEIERLAAGEDRS